MTQRFYTTFARLVIVVLIFAALYGVLIDELPGSILSICLALVQIMFLLIDLEDRIIALEQRDKHNRGR